MNCETVRGRLSAWHDAELPAADREAVDAHLAACPACRAAADELVALDARLRRVIKPDRAAAQNLAAAVIPQLQTPQPVIRRPGLWRTGLIAGLSAAAGFLIAWLLFTRPTLTKDQPTEFAKAPTKTLEPEPTIQLTIATGAVEVQQDGQWKAMPTGGMVGCGQAIRTTAITRCEFRTSEGSEVRLNHNTEVTFVTDRQVRLNKGQLMSSVRPAKEQFQVISGEHTVAALGTQFDMLRQDNRTALFVLEGKTEVKAGGESRVIEAMTQTELTGPNFDKSFRCPEPQLMQATGWVHELLVLKGRDNPEMVRRINHLMAGLGDVKVTYMAEEEIRALGDHCVVPLTRYLQSEQSKPRPDRRKMAARLIAELAQPTSIGDMIQLLTDDDEDVRASIAGGLKRLTGKDLQRPVDTWRRPDRAACESGQKSWADWWNQEKSKIPRTPK